MSQGGAAAHSPSASYEPSQTHRRGSSSCKRATATAAVSEMWCEGWRLRNCSVRSVGSSPVLSRKQAYFLFACSAFLLTHDSCALLCFFLVCRTEEFIELQVPPDAGNGTANAGVHSIVCCLPQLNACRGLQLFVNCRCYIQNKHAHHALMC